MRDCRVKLPDISEISYGCINSKEIGRIISSRCFIRSSATIAKDKIYIFGKKLLDIAERIVNDLLTGLRGLPSWIPVATYFSLLSNFNFNEHIFKRFTVRISAWKISLAKQFFHMASFWEFYTWKPLKQKLLQGTRFSFVTSN